MQLARSRLPLAIVLTTLGGQSTQAQQTHPGLAIVEWRRSQIALRTTPDSAPEMYSRDALPPQVDVTEIRNPFFRFTDPHTHAVWYVSQFDVRTNAIRAPVPPADILEGPCRQYGPQGMARNCP